jgi:hypothetical protein
VVQLAKRPPCNRAIDLSTRTSTSRRRYTDSAYQNCCSATDFSSCSLSTDMTKHKLNCEPSNNQNSSAMRSAASAGALVEWPLQEVSNSSVVTWTSSVGATGNLNVMKKSTQADPCILTFILRESAGASSYSRATNGGCRRPPRAA